MREALPYRIRVRAVRGVAEIEGEEEEKGWRRGRTLLVWWCGGGEGVIFPCVGDAERWMLPMWKEVESSEEVGSTYVGVGGSVHVLASRALRIWGFELSKKA